MVQNHGTGMISQGGREWRDYVVEAGIVPHLVTSAGIAARVQGLKRYYALLVYADGKVRLVKELDGTQVLAEKDFVFTWDDNIHLKLEVKGIHLKAWVNDSEAFNLEDTKSPLLEGGVALVVEEGRISCDKVMVFPARVQ